MGRFKEGLRMIWYCYIKRDRTEYAKKLGVRVGNGGQILANPYKCFGSEPWLIELGDHVDITEDVKFFTHDGGIWVARGLDQELNDFDSFKPIRVGNNVMIGVRSQIMPGVTIGDNVIIGGGSIVTRDIPSNSIVAGAPAKKISELDKYMEKVRSNIVPTKHMTAREKKKYLEKMKPEWFE